MFNLRMAAIAAVSIFLLLALTQESRAQWTRASGPQVMHFVDLTIIGGDLIGAANTAIFRSTDTGISWAVINSGLTILDIRCICAVMDTYLFAGTNGGGAFRSTDHGTNWTPVNEGLTDLTVYSLAANGVNLYAVTSTGAFYSNNFGASWSPVNAGFLILFLTVHDSNLYAGARNSVYRSTNNGASWTTLLTMGGNWDNFVFGPIAVKDSLIIVWYTYNGSGAVQRSTDDGTSWSFVNTGIYFARPEFIGDDLFAITNGDLYRSTDNGISFRALPIGCVTCLLASDSILYAGNGCGDGLFVSADAGTHWSARSGPSLTDGHILALAACPTGTSTVNLIAGESTKGLYVSTDSGDHWSAIDSVAGLFSPTPYGGINSLANLSSTLLAGTTSYEGIFRSTDSGNNWSIVYNNGNPSASVTAFTTSLNGSGDTVFFAGTSGDGLFRSVDHGVNWYSAHSGLAGVAIASLAVAHNGTIGTNLYAGTVGAGVLKSTDYGSSWTAMNNGLTGNQVRAFAVTGENLFAGISSEGVFRLPNNDTSWTAVNQGMTSFDLQSLAVVGTRLFAGTSNGVFLSTNDGTTWTDVSQGLLNSSVRCFANTSKDLFAGIWGGGVWRRPLSELTTSVNQTYSQSPGTFGLYQNYPNPFNPSTTIRYALPSRSYVTLSVFNTLGQLVATLVNEEEQPGYHELKFDGSNLASGVYLYRLQAGSIVQTKKLALVH